MSDESRLSYTWPYPGRPRGPYALSPRWPPIRSYLYPTSASSSWRRREVDHLELHGNPQHRWKYARDAHGRWSGVEVNP